MNTVVLPAIARRFQAVIVCVLVSVFRIVTSSCVSPPKPFATSYNGSTDTLYAEGTRLSYSCLIGFSSEDIYRSRLCLKDGTWTGRDQVCRLNFIDVFISLMAALGVVLIFIFLISCRLSQQRKTGFSDIKNRRSKKIKDPESTEAAVPVNNNPHPSIENPYESELPRRQDITEVSIESQLNKAFAANDIDATANDTSTDNELGADSNPGLSVNTSPLYYTPSLKKQGTGWIHDDTSFDSLELDDIKEVPEEENMSKL
ncbi:uncharacterized protein [Amphiura filiformis]|uniref:uncharacterized protein n=1 Tax=Amphiura filiformis TaxID=82378 RepID=UPI003B20DA40